MKPDIIISWPRNADYPLWRQMIRDNRDCFNEIIIVFTETNYGEDHRQFIKDAMFQDHVLFVQSPEVQTGEDWRNVAVNAGLLHSLHSEWLWFTEQDFFIEDLEGFFKVFDATSPNADFQWLGVYDGPRLHPCCIFIKRSLLQTLKKDFSAHPPEYDHFGRIQQQLEESGENTIESGWQHMAGLSHNMRLVADGELPNYKPDEFNAYLKRCLEVTVAQDPRFIQTAVNYLTKINYSDLNKS